MGLLESVVLRVRVTMLNDHVAPKGQIIWMIHVESGSSAIQG